MPTKEEIIVKTHLAHPDWTIEQIAKGAGTGVNAVRRAQGKRGLAIPSQHLLRARARLAAGGPAKLRTATL